MDDLDEIRRLLYAARYAARTDRYTLVGTLVNALAHHGLGLDPEAIGPEVLAVVEGGNDEWAIDRIAEITKAIADKRTPLPYD